MDMDTEAEWLELKCYHPEHRAYQQTGEAGNPQNQSKRMCDIIEIPNIISFISDRYYKRLAFKIHPLGDV